MQVWKTTGLLGARVSHFFQAQQVLEALKISEKLKSQIFQFPGASKGYWKQNLYLLQEKAPKPNAVLCRKPLQQRPRHFGAEFHGLIDRNEVFSDFWVF